ncbi:MAG: hypothetical protein F6K19_41640 [Cyanothece sp. SIO1E1]|nr:hypothetical protein [Cyanothece sp. SIO1E1]
MFRSVPIVGFLVFAACVCSSAKAVEDFATDTVSTTIQATQPSQSDESYTLGGGDRVRVSILRVEQYSGEHEVLVNGLLNLPLVGSVSVAGMTLAEAADAITAEYSQFLRNPRITVSLLTSRQLQLGIAGEVAHPGAYTLSRNDAQFPTLTRLLETAGGITQAADLRNVQIRRPQRSGPDRLITVDLWQFLQSGDLSYDVKLRDGDAVFIPAATTIDLAESPQLASASFAGDADQSISIAVVGEVNRPGTHTIDGLTTVTGALQVANGIKPMADIQQVKVYRPTRTGSQQIIKVNLWQLLQAGDLKQDFILQQGDTIQVPTLTEVDPGVVTQLAAASFSPATIRVNVVGEVARPGTVEVPPNTPLNQALLAAGGFSRDARKGDIALVRLNPDGSVARRDIAVDFAQGINDENNPSLRNNDVLIVSRSGLAKATDALGIITRPIGALFSLFNFPLNFLNILD